MNARRTFGRYFARIANITKKSMKVGTVVVIGIGVYKWKGSNVLHASWTATYEPSVKWDPNWDRREPTSLVRPPEGKGKEAMEEYNRKIREYTPTASRHLLLVRHGQYFDTAETDSERYLTNLGRAQAELTGLRLKGLALPYTTLISSTMTRALETARLIHKHLPKLSHVTDDSIREGAPIPPEPPIWGWRFEPRFFQDGARIESAFRKYFHRADPSQQEDTYEIVVCHANVIRYFICRTLQFPAEGWLRLSLAHASVTHVVIRPNGRVTVGTIGDHGHIPPDLISFN